MIAHWKLVAETFDDIPRTAKNRLVVCGNGSVRWAYLDPGGQWRFIHHRPMDNHPTHWDYPPEPA